LCRCPKIVLREDIAKAENTEKKYLGIRALSARMVRILVDAQKRSGSEISALHVQQVLRLADEGENGKVLQLPGGVDVRRDDDTLIFCRVRAAAQRANRRRSIRTRSNSAAEKPPLP